MSQVARILLILFFIFETVILPQTFPFRNYYEKHGLPSPIVRCIYQDSQGYLWFGTNRGVSRYDGENFKNFSKDKKFIDKKVNTIIEDQNGNLWIGLKKGVVTFTILNGALRIQQIKKFSNCSVYTIIEDEKEGLWFATSIGLFYFDGDKFHHYPTLKTLQTSSVFTSVFDKKGLLWLGTEKGVGCYNGGKFTDYTSNTYTNSFWHHPVTALLYDSEEGLWVGTRRGLNRLKNKNLTAYTMKNGLCHDSVTTIMEDTNNNIWVGTWEGVTLFSGDKTIKFTTKNGLPDNFVYSIFEDRERNIWFGTHRGASCLTSISLKSYTQNDGLPSDLVTHIIQDKKGDYWFATPEGLTSFSKGKFKRYTTNDGLICNTVNRLMEDRNGNIWIATTEGLSIYSNKKFFNYTTKNRLTSNIIIELSETKNGMVWIAHNKGLTCWEKGKFSLPPFGLSNATIMCIIEDSKGALWLSSSSTLYKFSNNRLKSCSEEYGTNISNINQIFEDGKGKIWLATLEGLYRINQGKLTLYSTTNSTLADNTCYSIAEDSHGDLWIGHSKGISYFNGKNFKTFTNSRMGLTDRAWFSGTKDNFGQLWFSSTEGVTVFSPPPIRDIAIPPPIYITNVRVMEKEIPQSHANRFRFDQNIFRFNFVGLSYISPTEIQYKYRLKNIDKNWKTTKDRTLFYPFLPPGSYNLQVKAINADGVESEKPAEYSFKILPPFWWSWWFLLGVSLLFIFLLIIGIQLRTKRVRERAELKERNRQLVTSQRMELMGTLAAGTVHDLKNLLAIIIEYSREASQDYNHNSTNYRNIEIIKDTASTAVQMARQILSFARPKGQETEEVDLGTVLSEILDTLKIMQPKNIEIIWLPSPIPIYYRIHPERLQQIVMNLCINAFHEMPNGGELKISLNIEENERKIILKIADTGIKGIKKENLDKIFNPLFSTKKHGAGTGLGLFVVKQIVEEYNGTILVNSQPGQGTCFSIMFPYSNPT